VVETFQGIAVLVIAVVPGALFLWSFERIAGAWGISLSDRLLRFVGISVFLHVLAAPVTYTLWRDYLRPDSFDNGNVFLPLWLWPVAVGYVAVPVLLGTGLAIGLKKELKWLTTLQVAPSPPTAWDAIFSAEPEGWILIRLKSGRWIGGRYAEGSYAGGFPEPPDLFLSEEYVVDQESEDFARNAEGDPRPQGEWGVLVRWDEVEYLEVTPT
jgi:hypothetical protein